MAEFHAFADKGEVAHAATALFVKLSHRAVGERGRFTVALSGGSTPCLFFQLLAAEPLWRAIPWDRTVVFWGDDRVVPTTHELSNYKLARDTLLSKVPIPEEQILRIKGELGAEQAAEDMRLNLVKAFGDQGLPCFDLVLQGLGMDGHTASLFPGTEALSSTDWVTSVIDPPASPKVDRVSLTFPVLNNARTALFLATGKEKQPIVAEIMNDPSASARYPAARLEAQNTFWYLDEAAFGITS